MKCFSIGDTVSMRRNGKYVGNGYYIKPVCENGFVTKVNVININRTTYWILEKNSGRTILTDIEYKYEVELYTCRMVLSEKFKF